MNYRLTKYFLGILMIGIFCHLPAQGQNHKIRGTVFDAKSNKPLVNANISITHLTDSISFYIASDSEGHFSTDRLGQGKYSLNISYLGYRSYKDTVHIAITDVNLGRIYLSNSSTTLKEVNITEPVPSVKQKGDTLEFNAEAYKVNPDAAAADLLQKMPGIEIDDRNVKAQGEDVNKVLIDGRPFFGNDPYASLEGLPASIIDKVQVYNEKSEQEQFTGFSEGTTTKTINIITDPDKRNGAFGRFSAGYGTDGKYLAGGNINQFSGDRRITITAQTNNINYQNFSDQNPVALPGGSGAGIATTNSLGINYSDKWGKKIDVTGSYLFEQTNNNIESELRRTYVLDADSGQVYNETNNTSYHNYNHNLSLRINYNIDSANSILIEPHLSIQKNYSSSSVLGNTVQLNTLLNETVNNYFSNQTWYNFSNDL
ncbi:MAG TPA: carboxypeptidase-like regulatory domain-containing protein, partial [Flavipsychrobacter sp.]|nr:carboxypeptidase-like regulatory domain-containing protein [Flavipsychrobacter sp.]